MGEQTLKNGLTRGVQRVLLADDDPDLLEGMRSLLMAWGYEVETAQDGRAALNKVGEVQPSLVITDVVMPAMNGLELLEAVKRDKPDIPVIVLTAHGSSETRHRAVTQGALAYLPKPVDTARLKSLLVKEPKSRPRAPAAAGSRMRASTRPHATATHKLVTGRRLTCRLQSTLSWTRSLSSPRVSWMDCRVVSMALVTRLMSRARSSAIARPFPAPSWFVPREVAGDLCRG